VNPLSLRQTLVERKGFEPFLLVCRTSVLPLSLTPQMVRVVGFEPTISCSQGRRISHAFLHPIKKLVPSRSIELRSDA
jgi:hypothetical protein